MGPFFHVFNKSTYRINLEFFHHRYLDRIQSVVPKHFAFVNGGRRYQHPYFNPVLTRMYANRIRLFAISVFSPDQKLIIGTIHFAAGNQTDSSQHDTYQMWRKEIITLHINYFPGLFFNHCYCAYWPQKVNSLNRSEEHTSELQSLMRI